MALTCLNCNHEIHANYYGGYIHKHQWQNHCGVQTKFLIGIDLIPKECGCTKPKT